jgi:tetratricopeptide (TPR) repeat protein
MSPEMETEDTITSLRGNDLILVKNVPTQILLNEGSLHFAHIDYDLAEQKFRKAVEFQRVLQRRGGECDARECLTHDGLLDIEGNLLVPCLNNLALCALYTCRLREAIDTIETLIREDPSKYLTDTVAFNLCTLYELGSDNETSEKNKRVLQSIAKRFTLHDIGMENFRLNQ